ncbi:MAG: TonB-dependent receptor plug domain-containing protein [Novosphingobium sp.]|nr:TonB-dependent receptor plug domain-containing protein [Novosphingobium sp.]
MNFRARVALSALGAGLASPCWAQETGDAPPPTPVEAPAPDVSKPVEGRRVYTPADFTRFAPKNAFDMLRNVPGFSIRENEQLRGLGQATGNILFNGERPSNKSDSLFTQLQRVPAASVTRIEIVDGAALDIPGLSGQVANIVFKSDAFSGQFEWRPQTRAHFAGPLFTRGQVSASGKAGSLEYEVGLNNNDSGRGSAGGLTRIFNGAGVVTERRNDIWTGRHDSPKLSGKLTFPGPLAGVGHLNASYQRIYRRYDEEGIRIGGGLPDRRRFIIERNDTWNYEIGGDYEFKLGPGKLKLIGLNRESHEPYRNDVITDFVDATPTVGDRFAQVGDITERIAKAEYGWKMFGGDWQLSGEAAFNKLDNVARLGTFDAGTGEFVETPFPEGSGGVMEDRYEGLLSFGQPLSKTLSFQIVAGAEHSTLSQSGINGLTRSFFRPKGTLSLTWKPAEDFDLSAKLRRRVGQLSFYDFLARSFINDDNQNAGNNQLVPQQDWSLEVEANKRLGAWGSVQLRLIGREVEDYVTVIPIGVASESIGNVPRAQVRSVDVNATINFDPIGWKGAKVDIHGLYQDAHLDDPFTGEQRPYNGLLDQLIEANLRHDIPGSDWAWGAGIEYFHVLPAFRRSSIDRNYQGPVFASFFVENKNVSGLTMRAELFNFLDGRQIRDRTVFTGLRGASPIAFIEKRDRLIGPIFAYSIKGTF